MRRLVTMVWTAFSGFVLGLGIWACMVIAEPSLEFVYLQPGFTTVTYNPIYIYTSMLVSPVACFGIWLSLTTVNPTRSVSVTSKTSTSGNRHGPSTANGTANPSNNANAVASNKLYVANSTPINNDVDILTQSEKVTIIIADPTPRNRNIRRRIIKWLLRVFKLRFFGSVVIVTAVMVAIHFITLAGIEASVNIVVGAPLTIVAILAALIFNCIGMWYYFHKYGKVRIVVGPGCISLATLCIRFIGFQACSWTRSATPILTEDLPIQSLLLSAGLVPIFLFIVMVLYIIDSMQVSYDVV